MISLICRSGGGAALPLLLASTLCFAAPPWPVSAEGLAPDPAWRWGRLPNGLRYVVRQNALPAERVSYRLAVEVGSAHEAQSETGFAHLVEHMAFNGTRRYPGETLPHALNQRGLSFGPEVSAFTFPTHTLYQFDCPGSSPEQVGWMLGVLRDFADGIAFDSKQVRREISVVESELRERRSPAARFDTARRREIYALSPLGRTLYGNPSGAKTAALKEFYRRWYRPERMILAVVGDAPVEELEAAVRAEFASLTNQGAPPTVNFGPLANPPGATAGVYHDDEGGGLWIELVSVLPNPGVDTLQERRRGYAADLAVQCLNQRLAEIVRANPTKYSLLEAQIQSTTPFAFETSVHVSTAPQSWTDAIATLDLELRRSLEYTFYANELAPARTRLLRAGEIHVTTARTADSATLAGWVIQEALWDLVSLSPEDRLRIAREILPSIDSREVARAWRSFWQEGRTRIFGYGYFPIAGAGPLFTRAFAERAQMEVPKPVAPQVLEFPYTQFGPAGALRSRRHDPVVDLHLLEFENGARVNLKRTTFAANQVDVALGFGGGLREAPREQASWVPLANAMFMNGGLGRLAPSELARVLSIEPVSLGFTAQDDRFTLAGNATSDRLPLLLQLICAYLTDPGWNENAFTAAVNQLRGAHWNCIQTAEGILTLNTFYQATHTDSRYRLPTPEELAATQLESIRTWLEPALRDAPLELAIVGDFTPEEIIPLLARTIGALPVRTRVATPTIPVRFAKQPVDFTFPAPPTAPRAAVQVLWPADQGKQVRASRQLEVLSSLLHNRLNLKIREALGAAYSPSADYWHSRTGDDEGYLTAFVSTDPKQAAKVRKLVLAEADALAQKGFTVAELREALVPILTRTRLQLTSNDYWLWHIALNAQSRPEVLSWPLTRTSDFQQITLEEINTLARDVLAKDRALKFTALPATK